MLCCGYGTDKNRLINGPNFDDNTLVPATLILPMLLEVSAESLKVKLQYNSTNQDGKCLPQWQSRWVASSICWEVKTCWVCATVCISSWPSWTWSPVSVGNCEYWIRSSRVSNLSPTKPPTTTLQKQFNRLRPIFNKYYTIHSIFVLC